MLFKGTRKRSAFEISQALEKVGGSLDAFTTKEQICVYAQVLRDHADLAVDVIDDMLLDSTFAPEHIETGKTGHPRRNPGRDGRARRRNP